jgi:hypothetical protein
MIPIGIMAQLDHLDDEAMQRQVAFHQARQIFNRVYIRSWLARLWAAICRRSNCLQDLRTIAATYPVGDRHYAGVQTVPIQQIRGSENRTQDFDAAFHPRRRHHEFRWIGVATALLQGEMLPPVELIQVGETYFVRDGHHRVSAARALGQLAIDAVVTVWDIQYPTCCETGCA